jgi:ribosomal protein L37AE/L43A
MQKIYQTNDVGEVIRFYKNRNLLRSKRPDCPKCNIEMNWRMRSIEDVYTWRCKKCSSFQSIKKGSFFECFKLPLVKINKVIHSRAMERRVSDVSHELSINEKTIINIYQKLRNLVIKSLNKKQIKLGGKNRIVEIDESLFIKAKYGRGKATKRKKVWVFGMTERSSNYCYFEVNIFFYFLIFLV